MPGTGLAVDGRMTQISNAPVKDADSVASQPQGTLRDQVQTMESEGQSQPQAGEVPPEEGHKGIPPLPEPNVEGVGNESGPSADKSAPHERRPVTK